MSEQEDPIKLSSESATQADKSWYEFVLVQEQKEAERVEDAAKYLSSMIGIAFAIFLKTDSQAFNNTNFSQITGLATGLWLLSLCLSFFIFYPMRYRYANTQASSIREMNRRVVRRKRGLLIASMALFFLSLSILTYVYFQC